MFQLSGFDIWRSFSILGLDQDGYRKLESRLRYLADEVRDGTLIDLDDPNFVEVELALSVYYSTVEPGTPTPWFIHTCGISNVFGGSVPQWFEELYPAKLPLLATPAAMTERLALIDRILVILSVSKDELECALAMGVIDLYVLDTLHCLISFRLRSFEHR